MKRILLPLLLCLCTLSSAQTKEKYFLFDFDVGANIDLINKEATLLASRAKTVPAFGMKFTHLFSDHIGWYTNVNFNFYKEKRSEMISSNIGEAFLSVLLGPISRAHFSADAGAVYRIEKNRWKIHPRAGIGFMNYLMNREGLKGVGKGDDKKTLEYKQNANVPFLNLGVSVNYFITPKFYFVLNTNFRQPMKRSYAELTYTNEVETDRVTYKNSSAGRNLNFALGFGFCSRPAGKN